MSRLTNQIISHTLQLLEFNMIRNLVKYFLIIKDYLKCQIDNVCNKSGHQTKFNVMFQQGM